MMETRRSTVNSIINSHVDDWIENFGRNIFLPDFFDDTQSLLPVHTLSDFTGESRFGDESMPGTDFQLNATILLMKMENEDRKKELVKTDETSLQNALTGRWKLISSSSNIDEFLKRRDASEIYDVTFQMADVHFEFPAAGIVSTFEQMGSMRFHKRSFKLSEPRHFGRVSCITYICDNRLKTVYQLDLNNGDEEVEERFLSANDKRLHIVMRRFGMECSRVYERIDEQQVAHFTEMELQNRRLCERVSELEEQLLSTRLSFLDSKFSGVWKNTDKSNVWRKITLKIENGKFHRKWNDLEFETWNFCSQGGHSPDGFRPMITADFKLVNCRSERDVEKEKVEYYLEDGMLIRMDYKENGRMISKMVFKKVYK